VRLSPECKAAASGFPRKITVRHELAHFSQSALLASSGVSNRLVIRKQDLSSDDRRHLDAAEGWTGLGNFDEALAELDRIKPRARSHLDVLHARWKVSAKAGCWEDCVKIARKMAQSFPDLPLSCVQLAMSLYTLGRLKEAVAVLEKAIERFGESPLLTISLACCLGKVGKLNRARLIVDQAMELWGDKTALGRFRRLAVLDLDLESLCREIQGDEPTS
jgi:tetratricopeptide (TPR) repeat protein